MNYLGDFNASVTVRIHFTTHAASGALVAPSAAFAAADFRIYKDGSATERASTNGVTVTSPFDSITGRHLIEINLADNSTAGFYSAGSDYRVEINSAKTVDGVVQSGVVIGTFSILNRSVNLGANAPANWINAAAIATAAITNAKFAANAIDAAAIAGNAITSAKVATGAITTATFAAGAINAAAIATDAFTAAKFAASSLNGKGDWNVGKTGYTLTQAFPANFANMVISVGGSVNSHVMTMATNSITADAAAADFIGASEIAASASQEIADLIAADWVAGDSSPLAIASAVWGWSSGRTLTANPGLDAAGVRTALGISSANLDTQLSAIDTVVDAIKVVSDKLATSIEDDGASGWQFTTLALANAPAGGGGGGAGGDDAATIYAYFTDGTRANAFKAITLDASGIRSAVGLTSANLNALLTTIDTVADAIQAKTDQLNFTVAGQVDANAMTIDPETVDDMSAAIATAVGLDVRTAAYTLAVDRTFLTQGEIRVKQRDDYAATDGRAFEVTITKPGVDFATATVVAGAGQEPGTPQIVPSVSLHNRTVGSCVLRIEFTSSQLNVDPGVYFWDAHILISGRRNTVVDGTINVEPKYADAPA